MPRKVGRPKKEIDYETVDKLSQLGCTIDEIANFLTIGATTLKNDAEFQTRYKKGLENTKMSLRRTQLQKALAGNVTMLIWLGKNMLGQKDNAEETAIKKEELKISKQKLELERLKVLGDDNEIEDDGFIKALDGKVDEVWNDGSEIEKVEE